MPQISASISKETKKIVESMSSYEKRSFSNMVDTLLAEAIKERSKLKKGGKKQ